MATARAQLSYVFIGPQKMQGVAALVRGRHVQEALDILKFTNKKGHEFYLKLFGQRLAMLIKKGKVDVDSLKVSKVDVVQGMQHYRVRPRARGSASWIRKKTSHVTVELEEK